MVLLSIAGTTRDVRIATYNNGFEASRCDFQTL